jgi:hypothetical protein
MTRAVRLLPIAFLFTGFVTFVDRSLNDELSRLAGIRDAFTQAVSDARGRLFTASWSAISDAQIQQNYTMGHINTVTQSLQGFVRPGEVSQIELLDEGCHLIARVPQDGHPITDLCQAIQRGKPAMIWQKSESGDAALVSLVHREIGGQQIFLAAQLMFDQAWVTLHPRLSSVISSRDVVIGDRGQGHGQIQGQSQGQSHGAVLWREGRLADGRFALPLIVDGWIYRIAPELTGLALVPLRENFWVLFGALGLVMLVALIQVGAGQRRDEQNRLMMDGWINEEQSGKDVPRVSRAWSEILASAKSLISARDEQRAQQMRLLRERVEYLNLRLREKEVEVARLEDKLAGMSDLASLQEQIQHTTGSFLRKIAAMRETCENIMDVAASGMTRQAKELHEFYERWKTGIHQGVNRELAARKFFRSLVEAQGARPGISKLDEDMALIERISVSTMDQALSTSILARQTVDDCEGVSQLAALWHGIAMRDRSTKTSRWYQCMASAQNLIHADDRYQSLTFESLPQLGNPEEMYPPAPEGALVSGFFHLYLALFQDTDLSEVRLPIVIRQKRFKDQASIILSMPMRKTAAVPESPSRQMFYHVDLAKQILSGCGIKVSILPPTGAGYPVGLTWAIPQKDISVDVLRPDEQTL